MAPTILRAQSQWVLTQSRTVLFAHESRRNFRAADGSWRQTGHGTECRTPYVVSGRTERCVTDARIVLHAAITALQVRVKCGLDGAGPLQDIVNPLFATAWGVDNIPSTTCTHRMENNSTFFSLTGYTMKSQKSSKRLVASAMFQIECFCIHKTQSFLDICINSNGNHNTHLDIKVSRRPFFTQLRTSLKFILLGIILITIKTPIPDWWHRVPYETERNSIIEFNQAK